MENEVRLIDANALFPYGAVPFVENDGFATADKLYGIIKNAPTIDPESLRPKGRWVTDGNGITYCEKCRHIDDYASVHNYCPICGAKMEG